VVTRKVDYGRNGNMKFRKQKGEVLEARSQGRELQPSLRAHDLEGEGRVDSELQRRRLVSADPIVSCKTQFK
jgi:hypothetical protein